MTAKNEAGTPRGRSRWTSELKVQTAGGPGPQGQERERC